MPAPPREAPRSSDRRPSTCSFGSSPSSAFFASMDSLRSCLYSSSCPRAMSGSVDSAASARAHAPAHRPPSALAFISACAVRAAAHLCDRRDVWRLRPTRRLCRRRPRLSALIALARLILGASVASALRRKLLPPPRRSKADVRSTIGSAPAPPPARLRLRFGARFKTTALQQRRAPHFSSSSPLRWGGARAWQARHLNLRRRRRHAPSRRARVDGDKGHAARHRCRSRSAATAATAAMGFILIFFRSLFSASRRFFSSSSSHGTLGATNKLLLLRFLSGCGETSSLAFQANRIERRRGLHHHRHQSRRMGKQLPRWDLFRRRAPQPSSSQHGISPPNSMLTRSQGMQAARPPSAQQRSAPSASRPKFGNSMGDSLNSDSETVSACVVYAAYFFNQCRLSNRRQTHACSGATAACARSSRAIAAPPPFPSRTRPRRPQSLLGASQAARYRHEHLRTRSSRVSERSERLAVVNKAGQKTQSAARTRSAFQLCWQC